MSRDVTVSEDNLSGIALSTRFEGELKKKKKYVVELSCDAICIKNLKTHRIYPLIVYMCVCV